MTEEDEFMAVWGVANSDVEDVNPPGIGLNCSLDELGDITLGNGTHSPEERLRQLEAVYGLLSGSHSPPTHVPPRFFDGSTMIPSCEPQLGADTGSQTKIFEVLSMRQISISVPCSLNHQHDKPGNLEICSISASEITLNYWKYTIHLEKHSCEVQHRIHLVDEGGTGCKERNSIKAQLKNLIADYRGSQTAEIYEFVHFLRQLCRLSGSVNLPAKTDQAV
jgi:hypothetical protein